MRGPSPPRAILAVDGKRVCGPKDADGHLLAAATTSRPGPRPDRRAPQDGRNPDVRPAAEPDQRRRDVDHCALSAHAARTRRYLHVRDADFVFCVKDNQPGLFAALDVLPRPDTPITHRTTDRGHGRPETRTPQVMPTPPDLPFRHVEQVFPVERAVTTMTGKPVSSVTILGVTSMNVDRGAPETIPQAVRGQWKIEALHWLRDTVHREDDSTVHTRSGPRTMAASRNLAIGALRPHGRTDIAEATRRATRNTARPFAILGLTP